MLRESSLEVSSQYRNRRVNERSRLIVEIYFAGTDATGVAHTRDISAGGLYMNTQHKLTEGDLIKIRIPLHAAPVTLDAQVAYSNPGHGVGLRFIGMSEENRAFLERELPAP
ncbi:MAG: PilZ domain-containing protein [Pyrinomonadaceae bacterium]